MAFGKAIVAPNQANLREILADGENARLFDPADDTSFREAVIEIARETGLRKRLEAGARRTIIERGYTWADNAGRVGTLYRRLGQRQNVDAR
jgi:glycosyltransferase involved in cell wall biosynthesis